MVLLLHRLYGVDAHAPVLWNQASNGFRYVVVGMT